MLASVARDCRKKNFSLLVSNPRFEIWLAFHWPDDLPEDTSKKALEAHLKTKIPGFQKSKFPVDGLLQLSMDAARSARALDQGQNALWPDPPGSRVYLLVEELHRKLRAPIAGEPAT
jgi:hypothetical protein